MPKKKNVVTLTGTAESITHVLKSTIEAAKKDIEIRGARLKDDFCNYTYELAKGPTAGDIVNRSGASIVHNDLKAAFNKLKPHFAVICEEIDGNKISDITLLEAIDPLDDWKKNTIESKVLQFSVSSISIEGSGEKESVVLTGTKKLSTDDLLQLKTPRIDFSGVYQFVDDLKVIIDDIKREVEEYANGKAAPKMVQLDLFEAEHLE